MKLKNFILLLCWIAVLVNVESRKKTKKLNTNNMKSNNEVKDEYKKNKYSEEKKGEGGIDRAHNENDKDGRKAKEEEEHGEDGNENENEEGGGGGGSCRLSMEELEILCCPSAHWIAALGTFLVLSPIPEIR